MVVPSAKSQSNWRKIDRNATYGPIQGKFRICCRVRTASWPWGWQDRRLRRRRGCCFIESLQGPLAAQITGGFAGVLFRRQHSATARGAGTGIAR